MADVNINIDADYVAPVSTEMDVNINEAWVDSYISSTQSLGTITSTHNITNITTLYSIGYIELSFSVGSLEMTVSIPN